MLCPSIETLYAYTIIIVILVIVLSSVSMYVLNSEGLVPWIAGIGGLIYLYVLGSFALSNAGFAQCDRPVPLVYPGSVAAAAVTTV